MRSRTRLSEPEVLRVLRLSAALGALLIIAFTSADTDLWGHVRFGEDILDDRLITAQDPYSFTSDRRWVNHEWLAEVFMALAYRAGGGPGLVALKMLVVGGALVLVSKALRRVPWQPLGHDALVALAIFGTLPRIHTMRPQVFSVLLFAALLMVLTAADRGDRRLLIAVPAVMLAWTNLHGGWIVGLGVLSIWVSVRLLRPLPGTVGRGWLAALWVASVAATLVNPYGTGLWMFLSETVGLSRPGIGDWKPLLESPALLLVPAAAVALTAVIALVKAGRTAEPAYVLIVIALAVGTLRISRIDAFFALAVVMLLGPYLGRVRARGWREGPSTAPPLWRRPLPVAIVVAVAVAFGAAAGSSATCVRVVDAPEPESVEYIRRHAPRAEVLTHFNWGQYAIWHLAPGVKVSMDGRRETVYSDELFRAHVRLYDGEPGATALVDRLKPDLIWLPVGEPAVAQLRREGWKLAFVGPKSVVLDTDLERPTVRVRAPSGKRCFPDA